MHNTHTYTYIHSKGYNQVNRKCQWFPWMLYLLKSMAIVLYFSFK